MPPSPLPTIYAIDFGTSNSLLAAANKETAFPPIALDSVSSDPTILRSVLYFPSGQRCFYGDDAIRQYIAEGMEGRLIRSMKRHLPSRNFHGTNIHDRPMSAEDLVGAILREMRSRANKHFQVDVRRVLLGRPARFSADPEDDAFAERRLEQAALKAGFTEVHFFPEPVAAAREFETGTLTEQIAMIADFGGGTSDFTVIRLGPRTFRPDDVLAIGGVAVAGDAFDASIMRHRVSKHFGADVTYRMPFGANVLRMPMGIVEQLCSPAHLSLLRRQDVAEFLRNVRSGSVGPDDKQKMDQLSVLVDDALGFQIFEAIEAAKRALSKAESCNVSFEYPMIHVQEHITRDAFEAGSANETAAILGAFDETVRSAGLTFGDIDRVYCTGGTARVSALAAGIRARVGAERMAEFNNFHAVVSGLALEARKLVQ